MKTTKKQTKDLLLLQLNQVAFFRMFQDTKVSVELQKEQHIQTVEMVKTEFWRSGNTKK